MKKPIVHRRLNLKFDIKKHGEKVKDHESVTIPDDTLNIRQLHDRLMSEPQFAARLQRQGMFTDSEELSVTDKPDMDLTDVTEKQIDLQRKIDTAEAEKQQAAQAAKEREELEKGEKPPADITESENK